MFRSPALVDMTGLHNFPCFCPVIPEKKDGSFQCPLVGETNYRAGGFSFSFFLQ